MAYQLARKQIGDIKIISKAGRDKNKRTLWNCLCLCGKEFVAVTYTLTSNNARESCGCCEWHIHHNEAYVSWCSMKQRCDYEKNKDYPRYGGRGIIYDPRWDKFTEFYKDMGDPPKDIMTGERLSLDREDNNGNYTKANCKWSYRSEQQLNKN